MTSKLLNDQAINEAKKIMQKRFAAMITYFIEDTTMYITELNIAIEKKNTEEIVAPAHTIKSSARQLGAEAVAVVAEKIENLVKNSNNIEENISSIATLAAEIEFTFKKTIAELKKLTN